MSIASSDRGNFLRSDRVSTSEYAPATLTHGFLPDAKKSLANFNTSRIVAGMTGDEMRRIRKKLGLTQVEFGALVGLAPNTIARQERDEIRIREPISKLVKILATQFEFKTTRGKH